MSKIDEAIKKLEKAKMDWFKSTKEEIEQLQAELKEAKEESGVLQAQIRILRKSKCPKCGYKFGIVKPSEALKKEK